MTLVRTAHLDPTLRAVVTSRRPMHYTDGHDAAADRPPYVRAASGMAWIDEAIAVVQDDANFVALFDLQADAARAIALPRGDDGRRQFDDARGNKHHKFDLESCVSITTDDRTMLLAFGSGSHARRRRIVTIDRWQDRQPRAIVHDATALYERLQAETAFAGSEMNIEGAVAVTGALRFFGRGNGKATRNLLPLNATCDLSFDALLAYLHGRTRVDPPAPTNVVQYHLGEIGGVALGFTDATPFGDGVLYSATAEASGDATTDGPVAGSALGTISASGRVRYARLTDDTGRLVHDKVEGVLLSRTSAQHAYIVLDADDATRASELCEVALIGAWQPR